MSSTIALGPMSNYMYDVVFLKFSATGEVYNHEILHSLFHFDGFGCSEQFVNGSSNDLQLQPRRIVFKPRFAVLHCHWLLSQKTLIGFYGEAIYFYFCLASPHRCDVACRYFEPIREIADRRIMLTAVHFLVYIYNRLFWIRETCKAEDKVVHIDAYFPEILFRRRSL